MVIVRERGRQYLWVTRLPHPRFRVRFLAESKAVSTHSRGKEVNLYVIQAVYGVSRHGLRRLAASMFEQGFRVDDSTYLSWRVALFFLFSASRQCTWGRSAIYFGPPSGSRLAVFPSELFQAGHCHLGKHGHLLHQLCQNWVSNQLLPVIVIL